MHDLFTITGRSGAAGCSLAQPDFDAQLANHNVIFRIPTPVFGDGLIEQIPDRAILANQALNAPQKHAWGISGHTISGETNNNGNDGTIARFGWKAQNKSLQLFAGEAYNVEQGITSELFPTERDETPSCQFGTTPNDFTHTDGTGPLGPLSDLEQFALFMRFLAPPTPSTTMPGGAASIASGSNLFNAVGCALCHTRSLTDLLSARRTHLRPAGRDPGAPEPGIGSQRRRREFQCAGGTAKAGSAELPSLAVTGIIVCDVSRCSRRRTTSRGGSNSPGCFTSRARGCKPA